MVISSAVAWFLGIFGPHDRFPKIRGNVDPRGPGRQAASTVKDGADQAACNCDPRTGVLDRAQTYSPRWVRIFSITGCSKITAIIFTELPYFGQSATVQPANRGGLRLPSR